MHRAGEIVTTIFDALQPLLEDGPTLDVQRNSSRLPYDHPAVVVRMGQDLPDSVGTHFIDWDLVVHTDILTRSNTTSLDEEALNIRNQIHVLLMANPDLNLAYVQSITPLGQSEPEYSGDGDKYTMAVRQSWQVKYRTSINDPSQ
ncbi:hypothetical protein CA267_001745 [Alteromonas pelagimontana]|uniref:DUF3168 domain-containing protein n=1 Tax=Alteromonas pelagimontana TaxID=1858656 RepID=A0A6M4M901_9ALTE|nr:hypothetical protein [Alteromonas pelagimontana]QJR79607.1 hypothetical protein CA267_001745 [Alteromonas pelagimontana]